MKPTANLRVLFPVLCCLGLAACSASSASSPNGAAAGTAGRGVGGAGTSGGSAGQSASGAAGTSASGVGGATAGSGAGGSNAGTGGASGNAGASGSAGGSAGQGAGGNAGQSAGGSAGQGTGGSAGKSGSAGTGGSSGGSAGNGGGAGTSGAGGAGTSGATGYDAIVLADGPVAYWAINKAPASEPDLTGNGHTGSYPKGASALVSLPNGDQAQDFNGSTQYMTVPSNAVFSIPTTGELTWEAWIRPDVLQFPHDDGSSGYVDWMGKCQDYGPTCEWEARMYSTTTQETPNRPNRISAYVFNPSAGLGSAADWQPAANLIQAMHWYHVVGEYTLKTAPADCANTAQYPGSIEIWVDGVQWDHSSHGSTGCMSQYMVVPKANTSPVNVGTMAIDSFFEGAIGKVAFYDKLLSAAQIKTHYVTMTGQQPTGTCGNTCSF
ncbi:MAG TPA: LamG-like jellyroll fold domain-containing protein [Polyangiaceae bacterium]|jgi:hypothetical protein